MKDANIMKLKLDWSAVSLRKQLEGYGVDKLIELYDITSNAIGTLALLGYLSTAERKKKYNELNKNIIKDIKEESVRI